MTRTVPSTSRRRILDSAVELVTTTGWSSITMAGLAEQAGFSRQTVYNEIGTRTELADAIVRDELGRFLAVVEESFDAHPDDLQDALHEAVSAVLRRAKDNPLLRAVVGATTGAETELLPPLTTRSILLLDTARAVVARRLTAYEIGADGPTIDAVVDLLVRTVLSHVMQPSGDPERTASGLAAVAVTVLGAGVAP